MSSTSGQAAEGAVASATVLEFARTPVPGRVKTRLARTEGAVEAARIYRGLAEEVHGALISCRDEIGARVVLYAADPHPMERTRLARWLSGADVVWVQPAGDLGARLSAGFHRAFEEGAKRVLAVGTDVVGLTPAFLRRAVESLAGADLVLAPTPDGGYGLIALDVPRPDLFRDVAWGTATVAATTRDRARRAGLRVVELAGLSDVDVASDLEGVVPWVTVLVPVLDEAPRLGGLLEDLSTQGRAHAAGTVEVVVTDGGSHDDSIRVARRYGARVVRGPRGRGGQLVRAARAARGRWLWTLHADTRLRPGTLDRALLHARRRASPWACFGAHIDAPGGSLRAIERLGELRARWLRTPYGDQGVLVRRAVYDRVGGYEPIELMEDVELARRLRPYGPPAWLGPGLVTDARRWRRMGVLGATLANQGLLARHLLLRHDARRLAAAYRAP